MTKFDEILTRYRRADAIEKLSFSPFVEFHATISPNWIEGEDRFWYARTLRRGTEFRVVDANSGANRLAFDHDLVAKGLSMTTGKSVSMSRLPISKLRFDGNVVLFDAFGKAWRFDGTKVVAETCPRHPVHWLLSPDGKKAAFLKQHNLWVRDLETACEVPLTDDGARHYSYAVQPEARDLVGGLVDKPNGILSTAGGAEGAALPEAMWSPDSRKIFTYQLDERQVKTLPSVLYAPQDGSLRPRAVETKYPLPGDKHVPEYRFVVIDVSTGCEVPAIYPRVEDSFIWLGYYSGNRAWWSGNAAYAYFLDMARGQKSVRIVEMCAVTGATRVLLEESAETYLEIGHTFEAPTVILPIPETDELIWFSQRTGHAHLYLYDLKTGKLKNPITSGSWSIRDANYFDARRREVVAQTMGRMKDRDYYYREIVRINVDTGSITPIASGNYDVSMYTEYGGMGGLSPNGEFVVSTRSRVDTLPIAELRNRLGEVVCVVEEAKNTATPAGSPSPEPVRTVAADGETTIYGVVFRPSDFDPQKSYPVLDFCHSNPFYAAAPKQPSSVYFPIAAAFAELGMVVVMLDGRGTCFREKRFRDFGYDDFLSNGGIVDRVAGIKQLAERYPYMDLCRTGIIDFDGSNAGVTGVLAFPDFYTVGVASSLYDPRLVKQGEIYMGLTTEQKRNDAVIWEDAVERLKAKLLIITGLRDSYFHPSATFRLTDALVKANKDFVHLVQPNGAHAWRAMNSRRRMWDFLTEHLIGQLPPKEYLMQSGWHAAFPEQMTEYV